MFENHAMLSAFDEALKAREQGEVPIGATITFKGEIIARAFNQMEAQQNPLAHAELIAIAKAQATLKEKFFYECNIYVTLEPCRMCMEAIKLMRFKRLFFAAHNHQHLHEYHDIEIYEGIMEEKSKLLLDEFFTSLRT